MAHNIVERLFTAKTLIRVAFTALSLSLIGVAHSETRYQTPSHNYYQNNWMSGG